MIRNAVPAGYEFSDSDEDSDENGFYSNKSRFKQNIVVKSPMELMKERLLQNLNNKDLNAIKEELDHGPVKGFDIDEPIDSYQNLLYHACSLALPEIVKYLVEQRGADTSVNETGETPLIVACYSETNSDDVLEVVKILIQASTNISAANLQGITALMLASQRGHFVVVQHLLSLNDAIDAIDNDGKNALFHAIDGKQKEIAALLIDHGIDLNVFNNDGFTAKHYAIDEYQHEIVKLFPEEIEQYSTPSSFMNYNKFQDLIPGMSDM